MTPLLAVEDLHKRFNPGDPLVLGGVTFTLEDGEIFALVGPSGCGKTTALRIIAGFERPCAGVVRLRDRVIAGPGAHTPPEDRGVGFVFQDYALFPHLSVLENVMFGLHRLARRAARKRAEEVLAMVGLSHVTERFPPQLSGGQQQRVALARSIAPSPRLLLLDEPFSNLDAGLRQATRTEVRDLLKRSGMSAILVTHDQEEALTMAGRLGVMNAGKLEQTGVPEQLYRQPASSFVAQFLGATNLIEATARGLHAETLLGNLPLDHTATGEVLLSVRPEQLSIEPMVDGVPGGEILTREFKGHDQTYRVLIQDRIVAVQTHPNSPWSVGDRVSVRPLEPAVVLRAASSE